MSNVFLDVYVRSAVEANSGETRGREQPPMTTVKAKIRL